MVLALVSGLGFRGFSSLISCVAPSCFYSEVRPSVETEEGDARIAEAVLMGVCYGQMNAFTLKIHG